MTGTSSIPTLIVIIIAIKRKQLIRKFKNGGATTALTAKTLTELNITRRLVFNRYLNRGVIKATDSERFFLSESDLIKDTNRRRLTAVIIIGILISFILVDVLVTHY